MSSISLITWESRAYPGAGGVAAIIVMTAEQWEAVGATFIETQIGDHDHDQLRAAAGRLQLNDRGVTPFFLLDYGEGLTYLVVDGAQTERPRLTAEIVEGLIAADAISDRSQVLELLGPVNLPNVAPFAGLTLEQYALFSFMEHWCQQLFDTGLFGGAEYMLTLAEAATDGTSPTLQQAYRELVELAHGWFVHDLPRPRFVTGTYDELLHHASRQFDHLNRR